MHALRAFLIDDVLKLEWEAVDKKTNNQAEILISCTNDKKNGGVDSYEKVATANLKD